MSTYVIESRNSAYSRQCSLAGMVPAKNAEFLPAKCRCDSSKCWTNRSRRRAPSAAAAGSITSQDTAPDAHSRSSAFRPIPGTWQNV